MLAVKTGKYIDRARLDFVRVGGGKSARLQFLLR